MADPASPPPSRGGIGHNAAGAFISIEAKLFNSLVAYAGAAGVRQSLSLPAGTTLGELAGRLGLPGQAIHLVLVNGRDITPELGGSIRISYVLEEGDVVAFSGPVPYSWGYGAPVV